ncbi:hypothetical protein [Streptacidiphilus jiangxiensis]|uniref:Uncharacterized protein n=1 Tax=Streptacidiphilus jiangxiensis TaxID=235985 RepID=A0A1H7QKU4_STRJI|nr:hypothetical protein [Streptacidiphilus jiangxiensis]SEL47877.1 hypothetical protein SAMN05414137_10947 [Streptacidiphilus jiangxiensis]
MSGDWVATFTFFRFQATVPNARGRHPGVFALANGLGREGRFDGDQHRAWREGNDWYDANLTNPSTVDPSVYDRSVHPDATAWFKSTAGEALDRVAGYLDLLSAHGVGCERLESTDPGTVVYEDAHQVVVVPHRA